MINSEYRKAITELLTVLENVEDDELNKIPPELIDYFKTNADKNYHFEIEENENFEDIELKKETKGLLSMIYRNYLCDNQKEKEAFEEILHQNEIKYQEELHEKYNPDNLFRKKEEKNEYNEINKENSALILKKKTIFDKIKLFVKNILQRMNKNK